MAGSSCDTSVSWVDPRCHFPGSCRYGGAVLHGSPAHRAERGLTQPRPSIPDPDHAGAGSFGSPMSSPAGAASVQNVFAPDTTAGFTQRLPPHGSVPRLHIVKDTRGGRDPLDDVCGTPSTEGPRHPGGGQARQRLCPAQPDPPDVASRCTVRPFGPRGRLHRCCRRRGRTRCAPCSWPSRGRGTCGGGHAIGHATMSPVELSIALAEAEDPSGTCTTSQPAT